MKILVRPFARAREILGTPTLTLDVPAGATVATLRDRLVEEHPGLAGLAPHLLFAVRTDYVDVDHTLANGDELAVFPPVSGG